MLANTIKSMNEIQIARDFTRYPAGRYRADGDYSGEVFREEFLKPVLEEHRHVIVDFDGAMGYGSSFLEEAFGGLVRDGYSKDLILDTFEFKSSDTSIIMEIEEYIKGATAE